MDMSNPPPPIPPRRSRSTPPQGHWRRYRRLMRWMAVLAAAAAVAAIALLRLTSDSPLPLHLIVATALGVGASVLLGTALMGLVFVSNQAGYDDEADRRGR